MRRLLAIVGAVIIFFLVLVIWGIVVGFLPQFPQLNVPIPLFSSNSILTDSRSPGSLKTDNILGLLLAVLAALSSYRASAGLGRLEDKPSVPRPSGEPTRG